MSPYGYRILVRKISYFIIKRKNRAFIGSAGYYPRFRGVNRLRDGLQRRAGELFPGNRCSNPGGARMPSPPPPVWRAACRMPAGAGGQPHRHPGGGWPCRDSSGAMMPGKGSSRFGGFVANALIMSDYSVRLAPVCRPDIIAWHIIF